MNIKTLLLVPGAIALSLSCVSVFPVAAQSGNTTAPMQWQRGMNKLNLTDAQKQQMQEIRQWAQTEIGKVVGAENLAKMQSLRQSGGKMRGQLKDMNLTDAQKQALRGIREETQRRMQAILTEEQRNLLQQKRQSRQEQRQQSQMRRQQPSGQAQ